MRTASALGWTFVCALGAVTALSACGSDDSGGSSSGGSAGASSGGTSSGGTSSGGTSSGGTSSGGSAGGGGTSTGGAAGGGGTATGGAAGGGSGGAAGSGGTGTGGTGTGGSSGNTAYDCTAPSGSPPALKLTEVGTGFSNPLIAESPVGDTARLFVGEQKGTIRIIKSGTKLATPFIDISGRITSGGERGLLGLAFHPSFAQNGLFYVHYSGNGKTAPTGDTVISEFKVSSSDPDVADPTSERVVLTVDQPESNHNGGAIHFGADGMLYIGLGDGGGGGDQHGTIGNGQSTDTMLGKILRIDPGSPGGGKQYGIPSGNMTGSGVLPELWAYGLRNPWRWSFDPCTADMYIGDVGQGKIEEIDVAPKGTTAGVNYGWRVMEGSTCYNATTCDKSGKTLPVTEYDHSKGCSVTGGYVYRGTAIPGLRGTYLFADYCSGRFWTFQYSGGAAQNVTEISTTINPNSYGISSFGQDASGEVYVTSFNGKVYRIDSK